MSITLRGLKHLKAGYGTRFFQLIHVHQELSGTKFSQTDSSCQWQLVINVQHMICTKSFSASFYSDRQLHHLLLTSFFFFFQGEMILKTNHSILSG